MQEDNNYKICMYSLLINELICSICEQNLEIISLRYLLSNYMEEPGQVYLRMEITDGLFPWGYSDQLEYYIREECGDKNPFEKKRYEALQKKAAHGLPLKYHPNIFTGFLK